MRHILPLFAFFITIITLPLSTAHARDSVLNIQESQTQSGITFWLVEDHSVPVISLQFAFRDAGAAYDPIKKQGLSQLASNTMDEGAGDLDSQTFQKTLNDLSINLRFTSARDYFGGHVKTLTKNKERAFDLLELALTKPRFDAEPVERMRNSNLARIRNSLSDPNWLAARLLNDKAFEGHVYAQNSGGTLSSLQNITSQDLHDFTQYLTRDRLVIAIAGDITKEDAATIIDKTFSALPAEKPRAQTPQAELKNTGQTFLFEQDIPQTIIEITQPGINKKDPAYQSAQIMNFVLGGSGFGSRLTEEVREKRGLTYGIYSSFLHLDKLDSYGVSTSTKNESVEETLSLIDQEFQKMKDAPITDEELESAKTYLIGALPLTLTSTDKISGLLLSIQLDDLPIDYLDQREDGIRGATKEDVQAVAQKILNPNAFLTILVGKPPESTYGAISATKIEDLPNVQ